MTKTKNNKLLKIFISNSDKYKHEPIYEVLIRKARKFGLSGATAQNDCLGYGSSEIINNISFWKITEKQSIAIEIIDEKSKIENFIVLINNIFQNLNKVCLIIVQNVSIVLFKSVES